MHDLALYYPHIHIRDDAWLKAAALYWPKLGRLAPPGWPRHDSDVARGLNDELGFLVDIHPHYYAAETSVLFGDLLRRELDSLRFRFALPHGAESAAGNAQSGYMNTGVVAPGPRVFRDGSTLAWLHLDKVSSHLVEDLVDARLAVSNRDPEWLGMHPDLVRVYTAALASQVAVANDMQTVTDVPDAYGTACGWSVDELADALLGFGKPAKRTSDEIAASYAMVAVRTVVPAGLDRVPVRKICKVRTALAGEFHAFRAHLDALSGTFEELAAIEDPAVLRARLEVMIDRELTVPTADLERALTQLGLEPARGVLSVTSPELSTLGGAAMSAAGVPPVVGQAGKAAAQLVGSAMTGRRAGSEQRRTAAGYLLGVREQLQPRGVVDRFRRLFTRS